ncbi:TetR/AcrR family transcriptional regulator [Microbacterium sp. p3-SID336]|uniref:TetR/AcrR family transcriptional regulator n=1 Tax=Microbacterium sp. p3-SID336 TaxID=2916212 RepID=UPI0021A7A497|nr:TetR family transcriptional regulator [Microbacterium sp. p3-SID336]MCT1476718.1 TetR family transcriptional regulator [Microbacterium sp. p3-SID336]
MARTHEQNRQARERARENIIQAAIEAFSERGVAGASVAEITSRAGVAQGLVNYHFGGKDQLIGAVIDRWFETVLGLARVDGAPDEMLAAIIDGTLMAAAFAMPLQRAVLAMQQQPATHRLFAESEQRHAEAVAAAEDAVRAVFRARGAADPALEEIMLRSTLEGIFVKYCVYGDTYPLEDARRWLHQRYGLPAPAEPMPLPNPPRDGEPRPRATASLRTSATHD